MWLYKILIAYHFKLFCIAIRYKQHYEKFADGTIKNIEEEIPFEIPENWCWCRLKDLVEVCSSRRILQSDWKNFGIPFYRAREIVKLSNSGFVNNDLYIDKSKYYDIVKNSSSTIPNAGDIMISAVGTIGKSYIVKNEDVFYYKDASVLCLKKFSNQNSKFLKIILDSSFLQRQMIKKSNGTTVDTITIDSSKYYLLCVPPLAEQQRIATKIEELFAQVDKIEEEKQSLLKLIDKTKGKVLDLAMKGKLVEQDPNDDPASVLLEKIFEEKQKLAKEGKIKLSKDELLPPKISDDNDYYKKFKSTHIMNLGNVCFLTKPSIQEMEILPYLEVKYLRNQIPAKLINKGMFITPGSNIILVDGENSGEVFKTNENGYMGSTFMQLIIPQCINQNYVKYFINSKKSMLKNNKKGSAIPHLNKELFKILNIYLPSINEQNKIVLKLDNFNNLITMIKAELS